MGYFSDFTCDGATVTKVNPKYVWGKCQVPQISPISSRFICYSTETLKYAQTSAFFSIVVC